MSLAALSHHLASQGRGNDSVLVHMTPKEVAGLQALAMANGGSLTINPQTGLPEAGFLSSLLPTLIGAGLTIASGGALSPLMAAGIVGGGTAAITGDLRKGLMAGLGAWGGGGMGSALSSLGTTAVGAEGLAAANASPDKIMALTGAKEAATAAGTAVPTGMEALKTGAQVAFNDPSRLVTAMGGGFPAAGKAAAAFAPVLTEQPTLSPIPFDRGNIRTFRRSNYEDGTEIGRAHV